MTSHSVQSRAQRSTALSFWLFGVLNNTSYVVIIAGANSILASEVGLVYFFAEAPTLLLKLTCPFWVHLLPYSRRSWLIAGLMAGGYTAVACGSTTSARLMGVVLCSLQAGLGEASCLGMCSLYRDSRGMVSWWSSGTGLAGIVGYAWVWLLHIKVGLSFPTTLLLATSHALLWLLVYNCVLGEPTSDVLRCVLTGELPTSNDGADDVIPGSSQVGSGDIGEGVVLHGSQVIPAAEQVSPQGRPQGRSRRARKDPTTTRVEGGSAPVTCTGDGTSSCRADDAHEDGWGGGDEDEEANCPLLEANRGPKPSGRPGPSATTRGNAFALMSARERLRNTVALWPYMTPLLVVYFSEYAMQSGTWTAIGFPVTDTEARHTFYVYANWMYQAGVCVSRSSGHLFQANTLVMWLMPLLQAGLLAFFFLDAVLHFWYSWSLLLPAFCTGLLGGAVYVAAFTNIALQVEPRLCEFSLTAASVGASIGIVLADVTGIIIQGCLFRLNGLQGAAFACKASGGEGGRRLQQMT